MSTSAPYDLSAADPSIPAQNSEMLVDPKTLTRLRKVVKDAKQAFARCTLLREQRREPNKKNALVERNYQGAPPLDARQLQNAGQGWRTNISTRPQATIIERAAPTYVAAVNGLTSLTQSRLRDRSAEGQKKTAKGREIVTNMIRGWIGWNDFVDQIGHETCKMGHAAAVRWDSDWRPAALRQGEFGVDKNALQDVDRLAEIYVDRDLQQHELYKLVIMDPEAAADAGWDVEAVAEAINCARPSSQYRDNNQREIAEQERQDTGIIQSDVPVVEAIIYLYAEIDGTVSKYIFRRDDGKKLFYSAQTDKRMSHCVRLFAAQQSTGKLYASRGLGHLLVNPAIVLDRLRCEFLDTIRLVSRAMLKQKEGSAVNAQVRISSPFIEVVGDVELAAMPVDLPLEGYLAADKALVGFMEVLAGAYLPSNLNAEQQPKTATEAAQTAQREDAIRGNLLVRFLRQMAGVVEMIQRAAFTADTIAAAVEARDQAKQGGRVVTVDEAEMLAELNAAISGHAEVTIHRLPDGVDEAAVLACMEMLDAGFSPMEIVEFALSPVQDPQRMAPQALGQQLRAVAAAYAASPFINHAEFVRMDVQQMAGPDVADALVLTQEDMQADEIQAIRLQILEIGAMIAGDDQPVSPLDNHAAHFKAYKTKAAALFQALSQLPTLPGGSQFGQRLQKIAQHGAAHLAFREQAGEKGQEMKGDQQFQKEIEKGLGDAMKRTQEQEAKAQQEAQMQAAAMERAQIEQEVLAKAQAQQQPAPQVQPAAAPEIPPQAFDQGIPADGPLPGEAPDPMAG